MMHRDRVNPIKINSFNVFSERLCVKHTTNYFESHNPQKVISWRRYEGPPRPANRYRLRTPPARVLFLSLDEWKEDVPAVWCGCDAIIRNADIPSCPARCEE